MGKFAPTFVLERYLFLEARSFPRDSLSESVRILKQINYLVKFGEKFS